MRSLQKTFKNGTWELWWRDLFGAGTYSKREAHLQEPLPPEKKLATTSISWHWQLLSKTLMLLVVMKPSVSSSLIDFNIFHHLFFVCTTCINDMWRRQNKNGMFHNQVSFFNITNNRNSKWAILNYATSHNEPQRATMSHNEPQRTATSHNKLQWVTTKHNHPQQATTNHNEPQQATMSHNDPQRATLTYNDLQLRHKMNKTHKNLHSLANELSPLNPLTAGKFPKISPWKSFETFFTDIAALHVWLAVYWNSNSKKNGKSYGKYFID